MFRLKNGGFWHESKKGGGRMKETAATIWVKRLVVIILLAVSIGTSAVSAQANEVHTAETEAAIRFTGVVVRPKPDPSPPEGPVASPDTGGNLPQTNEKQSIGMPFLGWFLLLIVGYLYSKRQQSKAECLQTSYADTRKTRKRK